MHKHMKFLGIWNKLAPHYIQRLELEMYIALLLVQMHVVSSSLATALFGHALHTLL